MYIVWIYRFVFLHTYLEKKTIRYIYIYIYIRCKVKVGPMFALLEITIGPSVLCFLFLKLLFSLQRGEYFWQNKQKQQQKTKFTMLKIGPSLLRNILGPIFKFDLDQFLTLKMCHFCFCFRVETTIAIVFSANHANFQDTKHTICEHTCANCSCPNVCFCCIFHLGISDFPNFWEMFW